MASAIELEIRRQQLLAERETLAAAAQTGDAEALQKIQQINRELAFVTQQLEQLFAINSSGAIAKDEQAARDENSVPVSPSPGQLIVSNNGRVQLPPDTTTTSNATTPDYIVNDFGTDADLRPYLQTQATPPGGNRTINGPINEDAFVPGNGALPGGQAGIGAANDDRGSANVVSSLNAIDWTDKIVAESNVLGQYASYTYQASLYLLDKSNFERILNTGSKNLTNAKLIVQSGGAPVGTERNDFFDLDYYIDRLELKSFIAGKAVRLSHNVKEVQMTIVEPNGMSFVQNLDAAVQQYLGSPDNKKRNFTSQIYLLVLRFYGYDDQGNLVRGGKTNNQTSDSNAFVEKWYPLIISKLGFRIANKAVEYEITAKAPPYQINASSGRGTIPFNVEFSGGTVKDVLAGPASYATTQTAVTAGSNAPTGTTTGGTTYSVEYTTGPDGSITPNFVPDNNTPVTTNRPPPTAAAITSNKATVRSGLMEALNKHQNDLVANGVIQYPDEYNVEFVLDSMASASIINPGLNKSATSMATPGTAADQKLGSKQSMDPKSQTISATAGMQIVQFIDNIVKGSSYIRDQQTVIVNAKDGTETPSGVNIKNTAWYKIGFKAVPKFDQYDEKRNDYAYKITYTIAPYKISQLNSTYFKPPVYNGVHKSYKYWFTGENTDVLSYEENLNSLYYIVLSNSNLAGATSSVAGANNINELLKYSPQTASGQATQGAEGRTLEPAANAADQLYSPGDLKECNMTIVGDPAWLQQGESFVALSKNDPFYFKAFLPDGTINFDSQQILFEVAFNAPRDYNLATGLIEPNRGKLNTTTQLDQQVQQPGPAQYSRIYIAKEVVSSFVKGKFTQTLKGSLMVYYPPGKGEGRPAPQNIPSNAQNTGQKAAQTIAKTPAWTPKTERSTVTNPTPSSALAKGTQQILNPPTQLDNPTLSQLQSSPTYIQARRGGATPAAALEAARAAYAAGTNNYSGAALPGIRTGLNYQGIVKDQ